MFGPHLMLDCYGCPRERLEDLDLVYKILDQYPDAIGMHKIMPPYVFRYSGLKPEDWGISGVVLIAESHITIHTFPEKGYASIDVFSCKEFDLEYATNYIIQAFDAKSFERNHINRGRDFPKDIGVALRLTKEERKERYQENIC